MPDRLAFVRPRALIDIGEISSVEKRKSETTMNSIEANGARIPAIGLGTMTLKDQVCIDAVKTALKLGYRHLDTAERYGNEEWVGEGLHQGLAEQGLKREDVFVTTKVYWDKLAPGDFEKSVEESLEKLELPWVDLLLSTGTTRRCRSSDSIMSLCNAKKKGQAKHVGVANFTTSMLDEAVKLATEPLVTNQIEVHPFLDQSKVLAACKKHGLSVTAIARSRAARCPATRRWSVSARRTAGARRGRAAPLAQQGMAVLIARTATAEISLADRAGVRFRAHGRRNG